MKQSVLPAAVTAAVLAFGFIYVGLTHSDYGTTALAGQPIGPTGLSRVNHGNTMTGSGTTTSALDVALGGSSPVGDITAVTAGTMLSGGATSGAATVNLADIASGTIIGRTVAGTGAPSALSSLPTAAMPALTGDVTTAGGSLSTAIATSAVTLAKMADLANGKIIGRNTAGTGVPEALGTLPTAAMPALTGDVANSAGSLSTTIQAGAVTLAKMASISTATFLGRTTAGTGAPEDLTATQATAMLNPVTTSLQGVAPASGGGTLNFLRADGNWAAPAGGAGGGVGWGGTWAAGTYAGGAIVQCGPYIFGANSSTAVAPCFDFGNLGDSTLWKINGSGTSQVTADPGGGGGYAVLTNAVNSEGNCAIYKTNVSGWDKRLLIVDTYSNGAADAIEFGILDGASSSTFVGSMVNGMAGWGVELQFYSGNPYIAPIVNGVLGSTTVMTTGIVNDNAPMNMLSSAGTTYFPNRYALNLVDVGGSTLTMSLYREVKSTQTDFPNSGFVNFTSAVPTTKKWVLWKTWTGLTRPTFTDWKMVFGAHTGGSNSTNIAIHAWAVDASATWAVIAEAPLWWIR